MSSLLSKIWFPAALLGGLTLQLGAGYRDVGTAGEESLFWVGAPADRVDTVKYPHNGYKRFWTPEERSATYVIADSLLRSDGGGFEEGEDTLVKLRPVALDTLIAPDSLLQIDTFRYYYFAALSDSLCHVWVRDSLINARDTLNWKRLDSLYAIDSVSRAKAAYWAWYATLDKQGRRRADFEREMPLKQARLDSLRNVKEEAQAVKDSIIENTPRILEAYVFKDSLRYQRLLKWTVDQDFHNLSLISPEDTGFNYRFYDFPIYREDVNATWLGVAGSPAQFYDFSKRTSREGVPFYDAVESWTYNPSNLPMYNTKTPYTELCYWGTLLAGDQKESDILHLLTTQNITPALNLTMFYDSFGGRGILQSEKTANKTGVVSANYTGKRYLMHAGYIHNSVTRTENGGVQDIRMIRDTTIEVREVGINLSNASSRITKNTVFLDQQLRIPFYFLENWRHRKDPAPDSLSLPEPSLPDEEETAEEGGQAAADSLVLDESRLTTAFIGHSSEYTTYTRVYQDVISDATGRAFYNNVFNYHPSTSYDSLRVMRLENKVFLRLQPWTDESLVSKLDVGIGHRLKNYYTFDRTQLYKPSNKPWNAAYLYAGIEGQFRQYLQWNAHGKYVFLGNEINDFDLGAEARVNLYPFRRHRTSPVSLYARFNTTLDEPDYYLQHLYTNHYRWDNDFTKISTTTVEGALSIPHWSLEAHVAYNLLAGNLWYDTQGIVRQNADPMSVLSASLMKNFQLGKVIHLDHRALFQLSSKPEVVPLPLVAVNARYYLQFPVGIDGAMIMQLGINAWYNTRWNTPAWNPALGVFHNQEENLYGNYPVMDVFANMQWKRACLFVKWENAGMSLWDHNDYFSADRYIRTTRGFKFGIYWPFYTQPAKDSPRAQERPSDGGATASRRR